MENKLNFECFGLEVFEGSICYENWKYTKYFNTFEEVYKDCKILESLGYITRVSCCDKYCQIIQYI